MQEGQWKVMPRFWLIKDKAPPKAKCTFESFDLKMHQTYLEFDSDVELWMDIYY